MRKKKDWFYFPKRPQHFKQNIKSISLLSKQHSPKRLPGTMQFVTTGDPLLFCSRDISLSTGIRFFCFAGASYGDALNGWRGVCDRSGTGHETPKRQDTPPLSALRTPTHRFRTNVLRVIFIHLAGWKRRAPSIIRQLPGSFSRTP